MMLVMPFPVHALKAALLVFCLREAVSFGGSSEDLCGDSCCSHLLPSPANTCPTLDEGLKMQFGYIDFGSNVSINEVEIFRTIPSGGVILLGYSTGKWVVANNSCTWEVQCNGSASLINQAAQAAYAERTTACKPIMDDCQAALDYDPRASRGPVDQPNVTDSDALCHDDMSRCHMSRHLSNGKNTICRLYDPLSDYYMGNNDTSYDCAKRASNGNVDFSSSAFNKYGFALASILQGRSGDAKFGLRTTNPTDPLAHLFVQQLSCPAGYYMSAQGTDQEPGISDDMKECSSCTDPDGC